MKKLSFFILLLCVFVACERATKDMEPSTISSVEAESSLRTTWDYDQIGLDHNSLMDSLENNSTIDTNTSTSTLVSIAFVEAESLGYDTLSISATTVETEVTEVLDCTFDFGCLALSGIPNNVGDKIYEFVASLEDSINLQDFHLAVVDFEADVILQGFTGLDYHALMTFAAVAEKSTDYWSDNPNQTDIETARLFRRRGGRLSEKKWFRWLKVGLADAFGAVGGAIGTGNPAGAATIGLLVSYIAKDAEGL